MTEHREWNLILMLDVQRFNRQGEPVELKTPCFWYQFLASGVQNLFQVAGDQKIGLCVMGLTVCCQQTYHHRNQPHQAYMP